jgi:hypothetical protein
LVAEEQVLYLILVQLELVVQVAVLRIQQAVMQELQVKVFQVVVPHLTEAVAEVEEQVKQVKDHYLDHKTPHPLNMVGMAEMV